MKKAPAGWKILVGAVIWLLLISWLHWQVNLDHGGRRVVKMGYMPVVTNLACPLLDYATRAGDGVRLEAMKFASFADMGEALRNGQIQVAFIIAPLSIVLHQQGAGVRVVYIGNRHESTLVVRKGLDANEFRDLAGKSLAVPMRYSGHNLTAMDLARETGILGSVRLVEMNPPDMPQALATGALDAYFVGEPFAAQAVKAGYARVLFRVGEVQPGFICNLMLLREDFIEDNRRLVASLVEGAARSGLWARAHPKEAAKIASRYWNQPEDLVEYALTTPEDRIVYTRFVPVEEELRRMAQQMVRSGMAKSDSVNGLVMDEFAKNADLTGITDFKSVFRNSGKKIASGDRK